MRTSTSCDSLRNANGLVIAIVSAVLGIATEAAASSVVIDFESFATGAQTSDFLSSEGISSITLVRDGSVVETVTVNPETSEPSGNASNPGGGNYLASAGNNISGTRLLTLDFSIELSRFSFERIDVDGLVSVPGTWEARAFDAAGADLGISTGENDPGFLFPDSKASFSLLAPAGTSIRRVEFTIAPNSSTFAVAPLDNLTLVPVPEPTTLGMLALGLMGLGRRKHVRSADRGDPGVPELASPDGGV
jgi:hypothetical protein